MRNIGVALCSLCMLLLGGCRSREAPAVQAAEAPPVLAAAMPVEPRPFTAIVPVTGSLISRTRVEVRAETFGRVLKFPKEEGERVRAGETVVWVEEDNYRLALKQAESSIHVAEAGVARAKVMAAHALNELDRAQNLIKSGGITEKDLKLAIVTEQDAESQVRVAEAQLDQARTSVEIARKKLADALIRAPVDGEIQKKHVNVGAYVEAPTPVFILVDNSRLELEAPLPASDLAQVRPGMRVTFTVSSYPDQRFEGRVIEIGPAVDADSRAAKVRIQVANTGGRLKSGMFAEGEIATDVAKSAIVIPTSAVYRNEKASGEGSVFVIADGHAVRRKLKLGRQLEGIVEVASGLNRGDVLITEQSLELAEGVRVQAREAQHVP
jgi:RND family efflux transporter MFP subunit